MEAYDVFLKNKHSNQIQKLMIANNNRLLKYLINIKWGGKKPQHKISFLEIGPGKGYLHKAIKSSPYSNYIEYYGCDRNTTILKNLEIDSKHMILTQLPEIDTDLKFDIIFVGYVIEHMKNGLELYETIANLNKILKQDGILVLQFPDCMKLGMEFYNIDYTHMLPTTKRNVNQALIDNEMYVYKATNINGLLYTKKVDSNLSYWVRKLIVAPYSYSFFNGISKLFYKRPIYDLNNIFWRAYALIKEPNVMFICKKK